MNVPLFSGLLVRLPAGAAGALRAGAGGARSFRTSALKFDLEPLFSTAHGPGAGPAVAAGRAEWHIARPRGDLRSPSAWDAAHEAAAALHAAGADFVEPDLIQEWPFRRPRDERLEAAAAAVCAFDDQVIGLPQQPGRFAWHLDDGFSGLRSARDAAHEKAPNAAVRIAHLDTGYDPGHDTFPLGRIDADLQRNFTGEGDPKDARDPQNSGLLKTPGHGTGTLSILAGARFVFAEHGYTFDELLGGAPDARIVPVRVGNSVVQFSTSSVARSIAYAVELGASAATRVDVLSMSMGGVASRAWAEAVNKAYEAGVVLVTAAGNNFSVGIFGVPTRFIVYPARFRRVIAACGVMADKTPYYGLSAGTMQGNWGPFSKMATAISAFTPNTSWAQIGCKSIVDMDGAGTSAATPQVAAAAALYVQVHAQALAALPQPWMKVEAVRRALFSTAQKRSGAIDEKLGNGILKARAALDVAPDAAGLTMTEPATASFAFLRVLTGLGAAPSPQDEMFALEATQLAQRWAGADEPNPFESAVPDPDDRPTASQQKKFLELLADHPGASQALRERVKEALDRISPAPAPPPAPPPPTDAGAGQDEAAPPSTPGPAAAPFEAPTPPFRRLRGYAIDPSLSTMLETVGVSEVRFQVPWENLGPGPVGEYLEVVDVDPPSNCVYDAVDLDNPALLAQDGLPPSEGTPQFHQQFAYAVASLTISNFEHALGRRALWRPGPSPDPANKFNDSHYVQRLRIYPHALREANAYYSPNKVALLLGYFSAGRDESGDHMPGSLVFSCLSHDIVAHETTHALLDGMHRRFIAGSNPDVRAFHEGFADIVALFQHFTFPEILRHQIASTRGEIRNHQSLLGSLATQFGRSMGLRGALRDAIGTFTKEGNWVPHDPRPGEYEGTNEPHARGAFLVAAVFDAFLSIYERRVADLLRLATRGTGVLEPGAIHPDLVNRLAGEAAKSAQHVLTMCIRALDYCPPTDLTFGEYLRALITADRDLVPDDDLNYRVAFVEAFRRRGIYPREIRTLSVESLLWRGPRDEPTPPSQTLARSLGKLRGFANEFLYAGSRERVFTLQRGMRAALHDWLRRHFDGEKEGRRDAAFLGIDPDPRRTFEVHTARIALRASPDGAVHPQLLVGLLQTEEKPIDPTGAATRETMMFEGGSTIVADLRSLEIRYVIRKNMISTNRLARQREFAMQGYDSARSTYLGVGALGAEDADDAEPFAVLHRGM